MGPLAGVKVLELAHIMSGPTAGMLLADMGADVIKVEKIPGGDDTRRFSPPEVNGEASAFLMMNRNKRGIALDLAHAAGKAVLRRLASAVDVVIENFRVGTMDKLGLGFDVLRQSNRALIYCAVSGYGLTGPDAHKGGFDLVAQGLSGLMRITGERGGAPTKVGSPVTENVAYDPAATLSGVLCCRAKQVSALSKHLLEPGRCSLLGSWRVAR